MNGFRLWRIVQRPRKLCLTSWGRAVLFGSLIWLIPLGVVALALSSFQESWRSLIESIMPAVVALLAVVFGVLYFRRASTFITEGVILGVLWSLMGLLINLTMVQYLGNVGVTYVIMPIITIAIATVFSAGQAAKPQL